MQEAHDELVWRALANTTRRAMLDALRAGPLTTGELGELFPELSRFAVMQHLRVLTEGGLVLVRRDGRKRYNYLNAVPIQAIHDRWVVRYMQPWVAALVDMRDELEARERDERA